MLSIVGHLSPYMIKAEHEHSGSIVCSNQVEGGHEVLGPLLKQNCTRKAYTTRRHCPTS